jgi:hypothetical protein
VTKPHAAVTHPELLYLDATRVEHPLGSMAGMTMCTQNDERLGSLGGVLVDPCSRRVRYFVVEQGGLRQRRYLLAADTPAVLEVVDRKVRVEAQPEDLERFSAG